MTQSALPWWKTATGYQVYPRSFCDSNGDGIGDIPGIISKLDHLADLGIGFIWLSPVYASPMVDNGYDIADYRDIAAEFGTLEDMDRLIAEARSRGIRIVMDLVVNHSSDQHPWFRKALADPASPERDYYVWRDAGPNGEPPYEKGACFGGSIWNWSEEAGQYFLGFFSPAQPDLNWQNPRLRREVYDLMNWWLDRGIGGFRMDVINLIGKDPDAGIFEDGPDLHRFLKEMHENTLAGRDVFSIGETWSVTPETALLYCGRERGELDMVFHFNHITAFEDPQFGKWQPKPFDLVTFKRIMFDWQAATAQDGWNSLFLSNHDLPRQVSRYGDPGRYRVRSARMLATVMHLMRGTPFVYQGEEIGMTNVGFTRLEQFRDVELLGTVEEQMAAGRTMEEVLAGARAICRDNARTPVQWNDGPNAGFTSGTPWIAVNDNFRQVNVARDRADPDGVSACYRRLIALRKELEIVSVGGFVPHAEEHPQVVAYTRETETERLAVIANFSGEEVAFEVPAAMAVSGRCLIHNVMPRDKVSGRLVLAPYEAFAVLGERG